ncbi:TCR/Tet family MFS transporter [Algimonas porphyrae]|uniref:Tetracycline resistance MFS efflux pump n=1 Tax=Algimonas porphyrae TaxID=1128113 RepID=A0ABQ5UVI2_9PROT|nr:TCR/Tet family MFS transporter [Algimonas porphyrae]GLQ19275.1 tetracycline resistance MFS efflux pump [Algimonas porphyrae]
MSNSFRDRNALVFVLITVAINAVGFGIIIPVLPELIRALTGLENNQAALHIGGMTFVFALLQFICMPIIGGLSDAWGRRPIMLASVGALALDYLLMALAPTVAILYLGRAISGAFGATFSTANAYIADTSPPEKRAQNFGLVGAVFGGGFILGPVIGGWLGEFGPRIPFFAAAAICGLNFVYGWLVLPETHKPEKRRAFSFARSNAIGSVKSLGRITGVRALLFVYFLLAIAHTVYPSSYTLSTQEALGWSTADVGNSLGAFGLASMVVQGWLIRIIIPKVGQYYAALIGIVGAALAYAILGNANAGWIVYAAGPFAALAGLYGPTLTNMMSIRFDETEQGELQGAIGAAQGLALMIGPLLMTGTFFVFANRDTSPVYMPGAPFLVAAILTILALLVFMKTTTKADRRNIMDAPEDGATK